MRTGQLTMATTGTLEAGKLDKRAHPLVSLALVVWIGHVNLYGGVGEVIVEDFCEGDAPLLIASDLLHYSQDCSHWFWEG